MFTTLINGEWTKVNSAEEICKQVKNLELFYKDYNAEIMKENEKLKDELYKDEVVKALVAERDSARSAMLNGFPITKEERVAIEDWKISHDRIIHKVPEGKYRYHGAIGGGLSYRFTPTSIGTIGTVYCETCVQRALSGSWGNRKEYEELLKEYDAEFTFTNISDS